MSAPLPPRREDEGAPHDDGQASGPARDRWQAEAACRDTVARAARCADLQQHADFAALFTEDAELQRPSGEALRGRAAILAAYAARPAGRLTRHLLAAGVIDWLSETEVAMLTPVLLYAGRSEDAAGPWGRPIDGPVVVGEFDDRLRLHADGRWLIALRTARFVIHQPARD